MENISKKVVDIIFIAIMSLVIAGIGTYIDRPQGSNYLQRFTVTFIGVIVAFVFFERTKKMKKNTNRVSHPHH